MEANQDSLFEQLLNTARNKVDLGDRITDVYRFLQSKCDNPEMVKRILRIVDEEKKAKESLEALLNWRRKSGVF